MKRVVVAVLATVMGVLGLAALGATTPASAADAVPTQWASVSTAGYATCGIDLEQGLYCWGYGGFGQLGNGSTDGVSQSTPTKVDDARWLSVRVSYYSVCAIRTDHTAWCWGSNEFGITGTNPSGDDTDYVTVPTKVVGSTTWDRVTPGYYSTCGISTAGALYCWGSDTDGSVGDGAGDSSTPKPRRVGTATSWSTVTTGYYGSCATTTAHQGYCWGDGSYGQNGSGSTDDAFAPSRLPGSWKTLNAVDETVCGVTVKNVSRCWGSNSSGQVGDGTTTDRTVPTTLSEQSGDFSRILPGYYTTCAVRSSDSGVRCFGYNGYAQYGDGTTNSSTTPVPGAGGKTGWKQLAVGDYTTCGVRINAKLFCWGYNGYGEAGVDPGLGYVTEPTQVGTTVTAPPDDRSTRPVDHGPRTRR